MNYGKGGCKCTSISGTTHMAPYPNACMGFALSFSPFLYFSTKRLRGLKVKSQSYDTPHQHKFCDAGAAKEGMRGKEEEEKRKKRRENTQSKSFLSTRLRSVAGYYLADLLSPCVFMCVCVCMYGCVGGPVRALEDCIVLNRYSYTMCR